MRRYEREDDYWAIRQFLRDVYLRNGRTEHSWQAQRFDYWRHFEIPVFGEGQLETDVFLWETPEGELAAVLNCEGRGRAFLQVDPRHRTLALEEEMVAAAEDHLSGIGTSTGRPYVAVEAQDADAMRTELLARRGYTLCMWQEVQRARDLSLPIPEGWVPPGYTIRSLGDAGDDVERRSWLRWHAFRPDEPAEAYSRWKGCHRFLQRQPLYRRDLDLVAEAPSGDIAAFATVWYDDATRACTFEPVGTVPEHQRKGLAKAVIAEGMRRAKEMGALMAVVGGGGPSNPPADSLYAQMFAREGVGTTGWLKYLDGEL